MQSPNRNHKLYRFHSTPKNRKLFLIENFHKHLQQPNRHQIELEKIIGILFPKLFCEENCSSDQGIFLKLETEDWEFAKISRSLEQFIRTWQWKITTIFKTFFFSLFLEFSQIWTQPSTYNQNSNWKEYLGFRNLLNRKVRKYNKRTAGRNSAQK